MERLLDRIEHLGLRLRQVAGEIAQERLFAKPSFIAVEHDAGRRRRRRICLGQRRVVLARIRRARRHIDERRDVRMHAGLGDDHAGEGMTDQHRRAVLPRQHPLGRSDRFRQRRQRILHGGGVEPRRLQSRDHLGPARAVGEQPMHEHDVARLRRSRIRGHAAGGDQRSRCAGQAGRSKKCVCSSSLHLSLQEQEQVDLSGARRIAFRPRYAFQRPFRNSISGACRPTMRPRWTIGRRLTTAAPRPRFPRRSR